MKRITPIQCIIVLGLLTFIGFLSSTIRSQSSKRSSVLAASVKESVSDKKLSVAGGQGGDGQRKLHLQDFHRVQLKNGKPIWEVKAKDAKYYAAEDLTHVTDAYLTLYRSEVSKVQLSAKGARLSLKGEQLQGAELEGTIVVIVNDDTRIETELASFNSEKGEITSPSQVIIQGPGYKITGIGFQMNITKQTFVMLKEVTSEFDSYAELSESL